MNVYRLVADMSHLFAILFLLFKICKTRSCAGISGKSQILLLIVFLARYLDLFFYFVSYYNTFMKVVFIGATALTVLLIFVVFKSTYDSEHDTFHLTFLLLPVAGLAFYINHDFTFVEVMWTFSIYLEAVAILPQFFMIRKTGEMEMFTYHYLFALGLYRAFYIFNWVYRYSQEGFLDAIAFWAGCVQTAFYCYFLYTKEFLKRQAHAYFQLHSRGKEDTEIKKGGEKDGEVIMIDAVGSSPEEEVHPPVCQVDSIDVPIAVPDLEHDGIDRMTHPLDPPGHDTAQADVTVPNQVDCIPSVTADGKTTVGEDANNSSVQLPQSLPQ